MQKIGVQVEKQVKRMKKVSEEQKAARLAEKQQRREELKALSQQFQIAMKNGLIQAESVNECLRMHYEQQGFTNLKTFNEWKEAGYSVKRGEKGCVLWAKPVASKAEKERIAEAKKQGKEEEAKEDFFPMCYLFGENQVYKIEN